MHSSRIDSRFTLIALLIAAATGLSCAEDPFRPDPGPLPGSELTGVSPLSVSATVASAVAVSVRLADSMGVAVPGATILFEVISGGGSLASASSVVTGTGGGAAGSWVLGTASGPNKLRVSAGSLTPVVFTATGQAGTATEVQTVSGDNQQGEEGEPLGSLLSVRAWDVYGNVVINRAVRFSVLTGGGTVEGGHAQTDHTGLATAGPWTLGQGNDQSVRATSGTGATILSATLAVCPAAVLATGAPIADALDAGDCEISGAYADRYEYTTPAAQALSISLESTDFTPRLTVTTSEGVPVANGSFVSGGSPIVLLSPAGSRLVTARSLDPHEAGSYTLQVAEVSGSVSDCGVAFIERGVVTAQQLEATDCYYTDYYYYYENASYHYDNFQIYMLAGSTLDMSLTATDFDPQVNVIGPGGMPYIGGCGSEPPCQFTMPTTGYYRLLVRPLVGDALGAYTLTIH